METVLIKFLARRVGSLRETAMHRTHFSARGVILICALLFNAAAANQGTEQQMTQDYKQINLYFVRWEIVTRTSLSPDDVRRMRHVYAEVTDKALISDLVTAIGATKFATRPSTEPEEARLVIELVRSNGQLDVYYANGQRLLTFDSTKAAPLSQRLMTALNFLRKTK